MIARKPLRDSASFAFAFALAVVAGVACDPAAPAREPVAIAPGDPGELRGPEAFAGIADEEARSRALFVEASKVIFHPRCLNCHPAGDVPLQGESSMLHDPPVFRGDDDRGLPGLRCEGCHQDVNLDHARVPGAPGWHLAPRSMAWEGRSPGAVCVQLKDTKRNGGKSVAEIVEHSEHDPLVAWGWKPGSDRPPAPGTQARFGALMKAWMDAGAACPPEGKR
jgi:hypothetical protein